MHSSCRARLLELHYGILLFPQHSYGGGYSNCHVCVETISILVRQKQFFMGATLSEGTGYIVGILTDCIYSH